MVETHLTPELIREGAALVEGLDKAGVSPDAALWFYFPDINAWRLLLAEVNVGPEARVASTERFRERFRRFEIRSLTFHSKTSFWRNPTRRLSSCSRRQ